MTETIHWSPGITLDAVEKMVILKAYYFFKCNKTATSSSLGISIRTLDTKLEKYEYEAQQEKERLENERRKREEHLARARGHVPDNVGIIYSSQIQGINPASRPRMEPIVNTPKESTMPVLERKEVQKVLLKQTSEIHSKRKI